MLAFLNILCWFAIGCILASQGLNVRKVSFWLIIALIFILQIIATELKCP